MRGRSLRLRLSVAIGGVVAASVLFVAVGTYIFVVWGEYQFWMALSPEAREAYERNWTETGVPPEPIHREISLAEEQFLEPVYEAELTMVVVLSAIIILVGGLVGIVIARRLTAPLESAAASARTIAGGDFAHRMQVPSHSTREVTSLAESFSHLAESLEKMEQNIRYTSASIAHEIRTPLTVIQGYLQGIRDGVFEADDERLDIMLRRMDALGRLVDDLKTLSLAQSGRLRLERSATRLRERLREIVVWMKSESGEARVVFEDAGDPAHDLAVLVDTERIEQVVLGLIHNALGHSGDDGRVVVRYHPSEQEAVITIDDDGPGFSDEALARASERFWRDESSGGSGLGLAVAKAVVEAHAGRLALANLEAGGASVEIRLPHAGSHPEPETEEST